jgi:NAD-dependent dihydropyrimidine dehydrogenase PreA subunit
MKTTRKVVKINEAKCNGCGICVPSCAEGALKIIGGKAKLVSETYCDGLGACLYECPQGAITIEERAAEEFNETTAKQHLSEEKSGTGHADAGCPSAKARVLNKADNDTGLGHQSSQLNHWPVQLTLVSTAAPFLKGADVVLAADCTAFAYADFHRDFLKNRALLVACPKLDDFDAHLEKLTEIIAKSGLKSLTVVRMEVPCCSGLTYMAKQAIAAANNPIPFREIVVGVNGEIKD